MGYLVQYHPVNRNSSCYMLPLKIVLTLIIKESSKFVFCEIEKVNIGHNWNFILRCCPDMYL